jgi:hypothetical protein
MLQLWNRLCVRRTARRVLAPSLAATAILLVAAAAPVAAQNITVSMNNHGILNGSSEVDTFNGTDFGKVNTASGSVSHSFYISNSAIQTLTLSTVTVTGANASDFTITSQPNPSIVHEYLSILTVAFNPSANGVRTATINIPNNDTGPFNFTVKGTGVSEALPPAPDLVIHAGAKATIKSTRVGEDYVVSIKGGLEVSNLGPVPTSDLSIQVIPSTDSFVYASDPPIFEQLIPGLPAHDPAHPVVKKIKLSIVPPGTSGNYLLRVTPKDGNESNWANNQELVPFHAFAF